MAHQHVRTVTRARNPDWQTVSSSNVHSALYAFETDDFLVRFLRPGADDIYVYPSRSPDEWDAFRTALSKGEWIWENPIRESWPFDLLTTRAFADVERGDLDPNARKFLD